jgi:hypothetical protein
MIAFKSEEDARNVMRVLPKRFGRFGLRLHPDKTRLVDFLHPRSSAGAAWASQAFDLLGFTTTGDRPKQVGVRRDLTQTPSPTMRRLQVVRNNRLCRGGAARDPLKEAARA